MNSEWELSSPSCALLPRGAILRYVAEEGVERGITNTFKLQTTRVVKWQKRKTTLDPEFGSNCEPWWSTKPHHLRDAHFMIFLILVKCQRPLIRMEKCELFSVQEERNFFRVTEIEFNKDGVCLCRLSLSIVQIFIFVWAYIYTHVFFDVLKMKWSPCTWKSKRKRLSLYYNNVTFLPCRVTLNYFLHRCVIFSYIKDIMIMSLHASSWMSKAGHRIYAVLFQPNHFEFSRRKHPA